jgi:thioredoxin-dependent peroxiredoxin
MVCVSELGELGAVNAEMKKRGGELFAISVDPPEASRRLVEKKELPFPILSDTERKVIQSYGLVHPHGGMHGEDIAIPAQILVGRDGKILNRHISARVTDRLDPDDVVEMIRKL